MGCPKSPCVSVCFSTQMVKLWMIGGSPILGNSLITGCQDSETNQTLVVLELSWLFSGGSVGHQEERVTGSYHFQENNVLGVGRPRKSN